MTPAEAFFDVYVSGQLVGQLAQRGDYTRFVIGEDYISDPKRPVLGLLFEDDLRARHASALRLPPWFSNLLPEGQLRDWIARDRRVSSDREMELLAQVGHDLPGAVRVVTAASGLPRLQTLAEESGAVGASPPSGGPTKWKFSLAGVALKFSMLRVHDRLTLPATGRGGDWIVKLPDHRFSGVPRNEFTMMTLAREVGLNVPEVELVHRDALSDLPHEAWPEGDTEAYAVKRFDRGPAREPIHIEDLAQVRGFYADWKYRGSYESVAALVYRRHDTESLREFARRLAFCALIANGDAHLKNWSLIYPDGRRPSLAPAYDLVSTAAYRARELGEEELALKLCGSRRLPNVTRAAFSRLGDSVGAPDADLATCAYEVATKVRRLWPELSHGVDDRVRAEVDGCVARVSKALGA